MFRGMIFRASFLFSLTAVAIAADNTPPDTAKVEQALGNLPLYFIENQGQIDSDDVAYYVKGADKTLYFTKEGITFSLQGEDERWTVKLEFVDANPNVVPRGADRQDAVFSYFKGKPEDWKAGCQTYAKVVYEDLWPGIDLVYSRTVNELKYEFVVAPGADPEAIRLAYRGASGIEVNESGELVIRTPVAAFEDGAPYAYQEVDGEQREVSLRYTTERVATEDEVCCGFEVGDFDPGRPVVLDPSMLVYCGYIGGSDNDSGGGISVDGQGNVYVTGWTLSDETSFPVVVGPDLTWKGPSGPFGGDAFVAKLSASSASLVYCGYIGGSDFDEGFDIAVDQQGNAYVTGYTFSDESTFPVTLGPDLTFNGASDAFVAKVNAQGMGLDYCGYVGGSGNDSAHGIAVDQQGNAYVTGNTDSDETSLPVTLGPDLTFNGPGGIWGGDAFVAKVNAQGTGLDYCGYIGGSGNDNGGDIVVDQQGNAYVTGKAKSDETSFPVTVGPDVTYNGFDDAFVAKVSASGASLVYCGYIGGDYDDDGYGIAVDSQGDAYVTGWTRSDETSFPVTVGPDLTFNEPFGLDAFVARVNLSGTGLDYCGYIGGHDSDWGHGIAVNSQGNAYVTGRTSSSKAEGFPVLVGPDLSHNGGSYVNDAFVARVNAQGTDLDYCGYVGGTSPDYGNGITVDDQGNAYVTGITGSDETSFPVTVGPDLTFNGGSKGDAFVAKLPRYHILLRAGNVVTGSYNPKDVLFVNGSAGDNCYRTIVNPTGNPVSLAMKAPPGGPNPAAFALYAWPGEAGPDDVAEQPYNIGTACFPMPLGSGIPYFPPYTMVNNIGYPFFLGNSQLPNIPAAPVYIFQNRILRQGTWTIQGIIYDDYSSGPSVSLTNAIVLIQQ